MKRKLDIQTWSRKDHFEFFSKFDEPFYGVCVNVDCTIAYRVAKENGVSFFLYSLYRSLEAAQIIEPFKYRIHSDEVFIYDQINAGTTIARANGTFGYGYMDYNPVLDVFIDTANKEVERIQSRTDLVRSPNEDLIRYSSLPWIDFTSISHARMFSVKDSCPRISFGKMTVNVDKRTMPVSIHVHHALVDGLHVGQYINCFQELLNKEI
ncbi:chloramphenicol O-acetyltransferase type A [Mucilaginibacter frigoritolerans]|jgi:chloramphenicol O-acetyltransferase type A|uniref:Chloramphenicol O-acetyltransferase type A n=1 Tax=Mucilaginibacter frigoritolerans TaxID=652788 RepID=A0A562U9B7_9SPHI|nr:chloramphenicol acetyltransferase [Mucilaginibacter frigoritolerans]TWJ02358.1 chloramphenicol O-acetyltransferase type A [Mucilaginibacter frigoritolerans]